MQSVAEHVMPDQPRTSASDVLSLLTGEVADIKAAAEALKKHTTSNQHIVGGEVAGFLLDLAERVLSDIEDITCSADCGRLAVHQWLDGKRCQECDEQERERLRDEVLS